MSGADDSGGECRDIVNGMKFRNHRPHERSYSGFHKPRLSVGSWIVDQIFVSSVQKELQGERFAVRDFVHGNDLLRQFFRVRQLSTARPRCESNPVSSPAPPLPPRYPLRWCNSNPVQQKKTEIQPSMMRWC